MNVLIAWRRQQNRVLSVCRRSMPKAFYAPADCKSRKGVNPPVLAKMQPFRTQYKWVPAFVKGFDFTILRVRQVKTWFRIWLVWFDRIATPHDPLPRCPAV